MVLCLVFRAIGPTGFGGPKDLGPGVLRHANHDLRMEYHTSPLARPAVRSRISALCVCAHASWLCKVSGDNPLHFGTETC